VSSKPRGAAAIAAGVHHAEADGPVAADKAAVTQPIRGVTPRLDEIRVAELTALLGGVAGA
jgi:hypothetical protein